VTGSAAPVILSPRRQGSTIRRVEGSRREDVGDVRHRRAKPGGHEVIGIVVRRNRKSVTVVFTDGGHWRVTLLMLKKLPADTVGLDKADAKSFAKVPGDLLELPERQLHDRGKA